MTQQCPDCAALADRLRAAATRLDAGDITDDAAHQALTGIAAGLDYVLTAFGDDSAERAAS